MPTSTRSGRVYSLKPLPKIKSKRNSVQHKHQQILLKKGIDIENKDSLISYIIELQETLNKVNQSNKENNDDNKQLNAKVSQLAKLLKSASKV